MKTVIPSLKLLTAILFAGLAACVATPRPSVNWGGGSIVVPASETLCLVIPIDGTFRGKVNADGGLRVVNRIESALTKTGRPTVKVSSMADGGLTECGMMSLDYMLVPEVLQFENRVTGWSGRPDFIRIAVALRMVSDHGRESRFEYYASSDFMTSAFLEWGNASPWALLKDVFDDAVRNLVNGSTASKSE